MCMKIESDIYICIYICICSYIYIYIYIHLSIIGKHIESISVYKIQQTMIIDRLTKMITEDEYRWIYKNERRSTDR